MRTFIAIELPKEIKEYLAGIQDKLKAAQADVKWVEPKNIHLTLKFLGDRDDKKIEKIKAIIEEITQSKNTFQICVSSLGAFPKISSPRVIWVGLDQGDAETINLAQGLEEKIAKIGIPKEDHPFSSHITIGRTRSGLNVEKLAEMLTNMAGLMPQSFKAAKITLFKSTLTAYGPIYEALKEANLKNT